MRCFAKYWLTPLLHRTIRIPRGLNRRESEIVARLRVSHSSIHPRVIRTKSYISYLVPGRRRELSKGDGDVQVPSLLRDTASRDNWILSGNGTAPRALHQEYARRVVHRVSSHGANQSTEKGMIDESMFFPAKLQDLCLEFNFWTPIYRAPKFKGFFSSFFLFFLVFVIKFRTIEIKFANDWPGTQSDKSGKSLKLQ